MVMSIAELILNSNLYFPHPFIKDYSHVKKHCYLCSQPHCYQALLLTLLLTMLIRVQVKLLFKGEVIDAPCSIAPGDEVIRQ